MSLTQAALAAAALATGLAGCAGPDSGAGPYPPDYYDYFFRAGIYDHHHDDDPDVTIDRPDRPRTPPGAIGQPRPVKPIARPPRGGFGRGAGGRGRR